MEQDLNFEGPRLANVNVSEPHFNDERTIQTARPVVPLTVFSRLLTRRRLALAGAFVLAALLGAGSALAIIQLRKPVPTSALQASDQEVSDEQPVAEVPPAEDNTQFSQEQSPAVRDLEIETGSVTTRRSTRARRAVMPNASQSPPKVTVSIKTNESQPQARLVDEWQERRQRRVRPDRPNNHHQRDLFRIREIFEGPRPE